LFLWDFLQCSQFLLDSQQFFRFRTQFLDCLRRKHAILLVTTAYVDTLRVHYDVAVVVIRTENAVSRLRYRCSVLLEYHPVLVENCNTFICIFVACVVAVMHVVSLMEVIRTIRSLRHGTTTTTTCISFGWDLLLSKLLFSWMAFITQLIRQGVIHQHCLSWLRKTVLRWGKWLYS